MRAWVIGMTRNRDSATQPRWSPRALGQARRRQGGWVGGGGRGSGSWKTGTNAGAEAATTPPRPAWIPLLDALMIAPTLRHLSSHTECVTSLAEHAKCQARCIGCTHIRNASACPRGPCSLCITRLNCTHTQRKDTCKCTHTCAYRDTHTHLLRELEQA